MTELSLSDLETHWSNVFSARQGESDTGTAARNALVVRYSQAVLRYLRRELRDEHAAAQLSSDFAVRVLEADRILQAADPRRGRFRDYLRVILRHMVVDYHRQQQRQNKLLEKLEREAAGSADAETEKEDQLFLSCWRQELLDQVLQELERVEKRTGQPYAALMRLQSQEPGLRSAQQAERLSAQWGRPFTAAGVRQISHRGRELAGDLLVAEVARSLQVDPNDRDALDRIEQEMIDLGLLFSYCKQALQRRRAR